MAVAPRPPAARFWEKVRFGPDCWEWQGGKMRKGYGKFAALGQYAAHRVAWILVRGPIPDGRFVLHQCDNPPCVRPDHLFLGTPQDNMDDMIAKGRARHPRFEGDRHWNAKHDPSVVDEIKRLRAGGLYYREIVDRTGIPMSTVHWIVNERGVTSSKI